MLSLQWLADKYQGPPREGSTKAGPRLYEPQGKRFTLLQGDSPSSRVFQYVSLPVSQAILTKFQPNMSNCSRTVRYSYHNIP